MKKLITTLAVVLSIGTMGAAQAYYSCEAKLAALENQIRIAEQYGNVHKVAGLKRAHAEVKAHCTTGSVTTDAQKKVQKLEAKLADKQNDIRSIQQDLKKAQSKGDLKKVAKYQQKLAEKQSDVHKIQQDLERARAELAALSK